MDETIWDRMATYHRQNATLAECVRQWRDDADEGHAYGSIRLHAPIQLDGWERPAQWLSVGQISNLAEMLKD